jgi:hypothetical protein
MLWHAHALLFYEKIDIYDRQENLGRRELMWLPCVPFRVCRARASCRARKGPVCSRRSAAGRGCARATSSPGWWFPSSSTTSSRALGEPSFSLFSPAGCLLRRLSFSSALCVCVHARSEVGTMLYATRSDWIGFLTNKQLGGSRGGQDCLLPHHPDPQGIPHHPTAATGLR